MYSVLIADDEEPVLDSYRYLIEHAVTGFKLCATARSGDEAVAMMYQYKPDIAFLDIAMPGMDGIEVIEQVHVRFPNTVFILSTAYERFDIAQRAIPLGVFAYLIKPVSKKTFIDTIEKVERFLAKSSDNKKNLQAVKKDFFAHKIWEPLSETEWNEMKKLCNFTHDYFCTVLIQCNQLYRNEITKRLSFKYNVHESEFLSMQLLLLPVEKNSEENLLPDIQRIIKGVFPETEEYAIGCGNIVMGTELFQSCSQALKQLSLKNMVQLKKEQQLVSTLRRTIKNFSEYETCLHLFTVCWKYIFSLYDFRIALAKMGMLFYLLCDDLFGVYSHSPEFEMDIDYSQAVLKIPDIVTWQTWGSEAFYSLYAKHRMLRLDNVPQPLKKALRYIQEQYSTPLQLSTVARETRISEAYLSRLFADNLHKGFSDFLADTRIDLAKERLLVKKDVSIKEIAFSVGFKDPNYFTKIFKKLTGVTPKEYREEHEKK